MTDRLRAFRAAPSLGRRLSIPALLVLAACSAEPQAPTAPPPAPAARPAVVPAPSPRPETLQERLRRERAEAAQATAAAAPGPASAMMAQYLSGVQDSLLARGLLRTDSGEMPGADRLAEDFIQIALRDEYVMQGGRLVPQAHAAPLRRWERPVRISVIFGDSVPPAIRTRDRGLVADFADRLQRATGHPVGLTGDNGNFVVMIVNEDERRSIGPRLAAAIPGIPPADLSAIERLAPQNYCTVFAYSPGAGAAYSNAVAVIRAELPDRLRLSCIHEELAQGMGLANDSPTARPSIFNDDEEFAYLTAHDERLLKMLYDPRLRPGMTEAEARPIVARIAAELASGPEPAPAPGA